MLRDGMQIQMDDGLQRGSVSSWVDKQEEERPLKGGFLGGSTSDYDSQDREPPRPAIGRR